MNESCHALSHKCISHDTHVTHTGPNDWVGVAHGSTHAMDQDVTHMSRIPDQIIEVWTPMMEEGAPMVVHTRLIKMLHTHHTHVTHTGPSGRGGGAHDGTHAADHVRFAAARKQRAQHIQLLYSWHWLHKSIVPYPQKSSIYTQKSPVYPQQCTIYAETAGAAYTTPVLITLNTQVDGPISANKHYICGNCGRSIYSSLFNTDNQMTGTSHYCNTMQRTQINDSIYAAIIYMYAYI